MPGIQQLGLVTTLALIGCGVQGSTAADVGVLATSAKTTKVDICHNTGDGASVIISVSTSAVDAHIENHGDTLVEDEVCDGIDNDCDGEVDEDSSGTWYADLDGDGWGDPEAVATDCEAPSGYVDNDGDCDDSDATVNPDATEVCDGIDNDCDGEADSGDTDTDGDGVTDCFDDSCDVSLGEAGTTTVDDTCLEPDIEVTDPWNADIEWQWVALSTSTSDMNSYITPKVGNLTDTNLDGDIDTSDTPNVLVLTGYGTLVLLEGDTGAEVWSATGFDGYAETAVADIDGDGLSDILAFTTSGYPTLLDGEGDTVWTATTGESLTYPMLTAADVDGDGVVEVVTSTHVFDGQTGALEATFSAPTGIPYYGPSVGDIDLDGDQEIVVGNQVYSPDGTLEWTSAVVGTYGHWSAMVDVDGDPEGEVLMVGGGKVVVHDDDGTVLYSTTTTAAARPGPICVADFDGDGEVEAAWGSNGVFSVFELDATMNWSATINDASGLAGCSAYDFDGDGVYEALMADQDTFWVFDGASGDVLFSQGGHNSGTLFEYPVVADVDADGSAEILYVSNYFDPGWGTLTVLGHDTDGWPRSGPTWPIHDFAATNVLSDGSIPTDPDPSWSVYNIYRARPSVDSAASNLLVEITDTCVSSCDDSIGTVSVAVQVSNEGGAGITDDIDLTIYDAESGNALDTQTLVGGIGGGETSDGVEFTVDLVDIGASGLVVVVDDDGSGGALGECDESDNEDSWVGPTCP